MNGRRVFWAVLFAASLSWLGCGRNAGNFQPLPPEPSEVVVPATTPEQTPAQKAAGRKR